MQSVMQSVIQSLMQSCNQITSLLHDAEGAGCGAAAEGAWHGPGR